jgi:hypothetical protein
MAIKEKAAVAANSKHHKHYKSLLDSMSTKSQTYLILKHLLEGKSLTPGYAYINFGCLRLAARIADLREMGVDITTERASVNGKSFAKYSIAGEGEK